MAKVIVFNCRSLLAGDSERPHTAFGLISAIARIPSDFTGTEAFGYTEMSTARTGVPACPVWSVSAIRTSLG